VQIATTIAGIQMTPVPVATVGRGAQDDVLRLFEEHGSSLYRFCRFTLGAEDEAEDIVQHTFLKLLEHLQAGGDRSNLRAWLFAVAANACRDRFRSRWRWLPWTADLDRRTVEPHDVSDRVRHAREAVRALAPRDRLLLSLRAQGLPYRDIAAAAGIREGSVGRLLARAVDRWKKRYAEGKSCAV
jgi:RNA polymerase sigma-70 factor (ECF subfamily)